MFSHFYLRQMQPEELYESLLVATAFDQTLRTAEEQDQTRNQWLRQFTIAFGTDDGDDTTTFNGTIPQTLMMFNSDLIRKATSTSRAAFSIKWRTIVDVEYRPHQPAVPGLVGPQADA